MTYLVTQQQTIFDLVIIIYGTMDKIVQLMLDNNINMVDLITPGTQLIYDNNFVPNPIRITTGNGLYNI